MLATSDIQLDGKHVLLKHQSVLDGLNPQDQHLNQRPDLSWLMHILFDYGYDSKRNLEFCLSKVSQTLFFQNQYFQSFD